MNRAWAVGDRFHHRKWWGPMQPAECEVISVRQDAYKGEPRTIVSVQEINGKRSAAYFSDEVPTRTSEEIRCLKSLI